MALAGFLRPHQIMSRYHALQDLGFISRQCHTLHLHLHALRQLLHSHAAPRWLRLSKMLYVFFIHLRKILHIRQEHRHLHYFGEIGSRGFENSGEVLYAEACFMADRAGGEGTVGESGELPGDVNGVGGGDRLGLGSGLLVVGQRW